MSHRSLPVPAALDKRQADEEGRRSLSAALTPAVRTFRSGLNSSDRHTPQRLSRSEITTTVEALDDIVTVLHHADPADKAEIDRQLGLRLTYDAQAETVHANIDLEVHRGDLVRVRGVIAP